MKLSEFIGLSDDQKRSTVLTQGVAIAKRSLTDQVAFLFQFPDYYVETFCGNENKEIQQYYVFQDTDQLAPYLDEIRIDQLMD